jgi:hypothetical protein
VPLLLALLASCLHAGEQRPDEPPEITIPSPDGSFTFRGFEDEVYGIEEQRSRRRLPMKGMTLEPMQNAVDALWSPTSKRVAINARCGGRYETTEIFEWNGKTFRQIGDVEQLIRPILSAEHARQLKKLKLPKESYEQRIWDTFEVKRWIDADTVEVRGYSERIARPKGAEEGEELSADFLFVVKLGKKGKLTIVSKKATPQEADEETAPEPSQDSEASTATSAEPHAKRE